MNLERHWWQTSRSGLSKALRPFSWLYYLADRLNRRLTLAKSKQVKVPVAVVGNTLIGGTGKSLMIDYLVDQLQARGLRVGVISRGYGGSYTQPSELPRNAAANLYGDEPSMLKQRFPDLVVSVAKKRLQAAQLIDDKVDIILSDDGLQHYALWRDCEIVMVDGDRGFGNQLILPAGPLREPCKRLTNVDFIVSKGAPAALSPDACLHIDSFTFIPLSLGVEFIPNEVNQAAIAGIGRPESFFNALSEQGVHSSHHSFPDHHNFSAQDFSLIDADVVLCTPKDAVKLERVSPLPVIVCYPCVKLSNTKIIDHLEALCRSTL